MENEEIVEQLFCFEMFYNNAQTFKESAWKGALSFTIWIPHSQQLLYEDFTKIYKIHFAFQSITPKSRTSKSGTSVRNDYSLRYSHHKITAAKIPNF